MLAKRNKKGFTLIELLAVIVILAVIALIATPLVLKYIDQARVESSKRSAENYLRAAENEVAASLLTGGSKINGEWTVTDEGYLKQGNKIIKVSVKGAKPKSGSRINFANGEIESSSLCVNEKVIDNGNELIGDCSDPESMKKVNRIILSETSGNLVHEEEKTINITIENKTNGKLSCISDDTDVVTCSIKDESLIVTTQGKEGTATVTVTLEGNEIFRKAQAAYFVSTKKGVQSVTANGYDGIYDGEAHGITVSSTNAIIKYGTSKGTYDLDESPKYTDVGEYTVYYEVTRAGFENAYGEQVIKITKAEGNISLESTLGTVEYDKTKEIEITENISNGEITISLSNNNIVEATIVNNKLVVKAKQTGSAVITLTSNGNKNYNSAITEYSVEVTKANNILTLSSSYGTYTYPNGGTFTIDENKSGGSLSCSSSDTKVATCSISGNTVTVTLGTTKGTATLTIKSAATTNYNATQAAYVVTTEAGALSYTPSGYTGVYDGKEHGITVTASGSTITYGTVEGTYNLTSSPKYTDVGEYTVYYKIEQAGYNVVTGSEKVKITKANGSVTAPTAKTLTYNESAQELINVGSSNTGTIEYKLDNGAYSTSIPTATNPGTYTVYYRVVGDKNHTDVAENSLKVTIIKATLQYTSEGYEGVYDGETHSIEVVSSKGIIMYGTTSGTYNLTENPKYTDVGEYTVYFKISREGYNDITGSETVKITKADNVLKLSATSGSYIYPNGGTFTITENKSGGTLSCTSSNNNVATCSISDNTVTVTLGTTKGTATLTIKSETTKNYNAGQVAYVATTASGALSVTANDYTGVYDGKEHGITVSANSGSLIKYGTVEGTYNLSDSPTYTDVGEYIVYYQVSLAGYNTATGSRTVTITKTNGTVSAPTAKTLTYNGSEQTLINAGSSTTGTIQYKLDNGTYSTALPTGTNAGSYTVYYKVVGDKNHNDVAEKSITVTIAKATGSVSAPTAKSLTYTGSAQTLINAGSTNTGTIQYKLNNGTYSTSLPTATEAGNYTVYYKVVGNSNYNDVAEKSITVTIAKANNTLTLSASSGTHVYPTSGTFTVDTNTSGGSLSCSSNNTAVATCSISGTKVTVTPGTTAGTATLTIISAETANYKAGQASYVVTGKAGTLSVTANGYNAAYDGSAHGITVSANSGATIKYGTAAGTYNLTSSPTYTDVGTYTVHYQVSLVGYDTVTGYRDVVITKANGSVTAPIAKTNLTYTGSAQTLISAGSSNTGTIQYSLDGTNYSTSLPKGTNAGTYTVYYRVIGNSTYNDVAASSITVTIKKAKNTITLSSYSGTITYPDKIIVTVTTKDGDGLRSCSSSSSKVTCANVSGNAYLYANDIGTATITLLSEETENYSSQSTTFEATVVLGNLNVNASGYSGTYDGSAHGITVTADDGATIKYGTTSGTYNLTTSPTYSTAGTYTVYYQVSKTRYNTVTGSRTVTIAKKSNTLTLSTNSGTYKYPTAGTFTVSTNSSGGTLSCASSNTNVATCSISSNTVTVTPGTTKGTSNITITSAATTNYNSATATHVATSELGTLSVTANDKTVTYTGASHGITVTSSGATIRYGTSSSNITLTSSPAYAAAGTYTIWYQVSKAGYNTVTGSKTLTINKASGSVTTKPTGKSLSYTGSAQTLITAGSGTGTMYYRLGTSGSYSTSLPTATAAGTYTIYYYAGSSTNYNSTSSSPGTVTATITDYPYYGNVTFAYDSSMGGYMGEICISSSKFKNNYRYSLSVAGTSSVELLSQIDGSTYAFGNATSRNAIILESSGSNLCGQILTNKISSAGTYNVKLSYVGTNSSNYIIRISASGRIYFASTTKFGNEGEEMGLVFGDSNNQLLLLMAEEIGYNGTHYYLIGSASNQLLNKLSAGEKVNAYLTQDGETTLKSFENITFNYVSSEPAFYDCHEAPYYYYGNNNMVEGSC